MGEQIAEGKAREELLRKAMGYLNEYGGSPEYLLLYQRSGQRLGQAFFNALNTRNQEMVRGTENDPFYDDHRIDGCISFLVREAKMEEAAQRARFNND